MFPSRCAKIMLMDQHIGNIGVIHPNVLQNYELNYPCSAFELSLELLQSFVNF